MKKIYLLLLGFSFLVAEPTTITIGTITPNGSLWTKTLNKMSKEIQRKTDEEVKLKVKIYPRSDDQEKQMIHKILENKLDGGLFLQAGIDEVVPEIALMRLPYLFQTKEEWSKAHKEMQKSIEASMENKKLIPLGWLDSGFAYLYTRSPIRSMEDYKKQKTWLFQGAALMQSCLKEMQVSGVAMETSDVLEGLKAGKIDCVFASPYLLVALRWHSHVKYCVDLPISNVVGGLVMSDATYQKIPKKHRKQVLKICQKYMKNLSKSVDQENQVAIQLLKEKEKIEFIRPNDNVQQQLKEFGDKVAKKQAGVLYSQQQLQQLQNLLKR